jgi:hypothetical protein
LPVEGRFPKQNKQFYVEMTMSTLPGYPIILIDRLYVFWLLFQK